MALLQLRARGPEDILAADERPFFRAWKWIDRGLPAIRREGRARRWEFWVRETIAASYSDMTFSMDVRPTLEHSSHGIAGLPPLPDWLFGSARKPRDRLEDLWETVTGGRPVVHEQEPRYDDDDDLDSVGAHWEDLEWTADEFRRKALFKAFRAGLAEQRGEVERASRVIGEAMLEWSCRPGGASARLAQRSFERGGSATALMTASSCRRAD